MNLRCRNLLQGRVGGILIGLILYVGVKKKENNVMFRVGGTRLTRTSQEASQSRQIQDTLPDVSLSPLSSFNSVKFTLSEDL